MNLSTNQEHTTTNQAPPDLNITKLPPVSPQSAVVPQSTMSLQQPTNQPSVLNPSSFRPEDDSPLAKILSLMTHPLVRKLTAFGLTAQGLYGVYQSTFFVLVKFPELEARLAAHTITQIEVNNIAVEAILVIISTIISMFFALHLIRNKAGEILSPVLGVVLFLGNTYLFNFFKSLPLVESWGLLVDKLLGL